MTCYAFSSQTGITDLSKVAALSVVARNTAFTFKGRAIDVAEVAQRMNLTHVIEGSVRKSGSRLRISAQLVDGATAYLRTGLRGRCPRQTGRG